MKLRFLLPSVIFLFGSMISHAQVTERYSQGFESGETVRYSVTPSTSGSPSSTYHSGGARSMVLSQSTTTDVVFITDTIDLRGTSTTQFMSLEFDHICNLAPEGSANHMGRIFYKRSANPTDTTWTPLNSQQYNMDDGGSSNFSYTGSFNSSSYTSWMSGYDNTSWMSERFDITINSNVASNERLYQFKFVVRKKTSTGQAGSWLLDNVKVLSSPSQRKKPLLTMVKYPDGYYHPSSRGASILLDAVSPLSEGINPDSVYLYYRVGSDPTPIKLPMSQVAGVANRYGVTIPFNGYDTMMSFYCVVRDATSNANMVTFPSAADSWIDYACVRGVAQPGILTDGFTGTSNSTNVPFPPLADGRCEMVYDSALMASAGYGPGAITALKFMMGAHTNEVTRPSFRIKMKNVPTSYAVDVSGGGGMYYFTSSYMHMVYNTALTIEEANTNSMQTIQLQDTFYYAGKDLVVQIAYDGQVDFPSTNVKHIPAVSTKPTIWNSTGLAGNGYNYNSSDMAYGDMTLATRPAFVFTQQANLPLYHDMGISELVSPNYNTAMSRPGNLTVKLKNFGVNTVNGVRVRYQIDDTVSGSYDWTGNMAGGADQTITIANNLMLTPGFHRLCVWVDDTLTVGSNLIRDHEPYNDTSCSEFVVCDGAMSGVRQIGGPGPDFNTIEEFLFSVSRCGINDSLVVKLAPGSYRPFTVPAISGLTASHYIVFEPLSGNVTLFADDGTADAIVNLEAASNIRFRNINFVRRAGTLTDMVTLGLASHNCHFENCQFIDSIDNPAASMRINTMVNSGFSNGLVVDGCTFYGGKVGIDAKGQASDNLSTGYVLKNNVLYGQFDNAIKAQNLTNMLIEKNELYDVMNNASYVLLVNYCRGTSKVLSNKIYTSHGAGGIGLNNAGGTSTVRFILANNMVVCEDDGSANQMNPPINIIQATWGDIVYNSVKLTAPTRSNIGAVTFGGGTLENSRFLNNIVVSLDNNNYALNYIPGTATTNTVGHNIYYSMGTTLNRKAGSLYGNLTQWLTTEPTDTASVYVNPNFLNGSLVDLRTYNRQVKGVGIPLATVTTDMFDSVRSTTATCAGAFEFVSLPYDFEPEALISPELTTCYMPAEVELVVRLRNSGINSYTGNDLTISYQVGNGATHTVTVTDTVPGEDTVTIHTGAMLSLPPRPTSDSTYRLRVWTTYANDPNQTNDENIFHVTSKYHPAKPNNYTLNVNYADTAVLTPTAGVSTWSVYNASTAPGRKSQLFWYHDSTDVEPFFVGNTLVTDTLRMDTTFYFRQRRAQPIVRMTQLEIARTASGANATVGLTPSMPYWMAPASGSSGRKIVLQLTNVGDARACLYGDSIVSYLKASGNPQIKTFVFTDSIFIEPGQSFVVQYVGGSSANPAMTIHTGSSVAFTVQNTAKVAFVYKRNGVIEDAIALNGITSESCWTDLSVPSYVWSGNGIDTAGSRNSAGLVRVNFQGNRFDWSWANATSPMFLNTNNPAWVRYIDNGCDGYFATATVSLISPPSADLDLSTPSAPTTSCGLGMEPVSVTVHNYGIQPVTGLVLNYSIGGDTVTESVSQTLSANGTITHTFATPMNLLFGQDSIVTLRVWANAITADPSHLNDTSMVVFPVYYTPEAPDPIAAHVVSYATRDTVSITPTPGVVPVWYDYDLNPIDTGYNHVSEILYVGGTRAMGYIATTSVMGQVGEGTSTNGNSSYPSPYQPGKKNAKQQYVYSASELRAAGLSEGNITAIAFDLNNIVSSSVDSIEFDEYYISMGSTSDTIFSGNSDWKSTQLAFSRAPFTIYRSEIGQWQPRYLDEPFYWDGRSSIVVQVVHGISSAITSGVKCTYTSKNNTALTKSDNSALSPSTMAFSGSGTRSGNRPNIRFYNTVYSCSGPYTTYSVQMVNVPSVDMAILWPAGVDTVAHNSCDSISVEVNLRNQGTSALSGTKVYYYFDTLAVDSVTVATSIASGATQTVEIIKRPMMPGRHTVRAIVSASGDLITSNDTITRTFMVRYCGGTYTIAQTGGDYASFGEAIDTLNVVGIEGPVVFNVMDGIYQEQVVMTNIQGSSTTNTVSFVGTGDSVLLTAATSQAANYVFLIDSASNVVLSNFRIEARPASGNYANALVMQKGGNITVNSCTIRVKGTINNANASCVILDGGISGLAMVNNVIDSGYYSIKSTGSDVSYSNIILRNNDITNFMSQGVTLRQVTDIDITSNRITSGVTTSSRALKGIYLGETEGTLSIQKNKIYLIDNVNGGKLGIQLENVNCMSSAPGYIVNNMISCSGTGTAGLSALKPSGIWIDSSSANLNVYYNTVRVYCGPYANNAFSDASYSFFTGPTVANINVMNNIFSNFSKGYAYFVSELGTVTFSNYNAYYSVSTKPLAWQQTDLANLAALQAVNGGDANSRFEEPYFVSDYDLHLVMTNFVSYALYTSDVTEDIDGNLRLPIPAPTIGAHQMELNTHDMSVVRIIEPVMPTNYNFSYPNNMPPNIESDSIRVIAQFFNNGQSTETNVEWYAYVEGHESEIRSPNKNMGTFMPSQLKTDTVMMATPLGIIDTQTVHVVVILPNDSSMIDNDRTAPVYLAPAFNFAATRIAPVSSDGCARKNTMLRLTIQNNGYKDIPAGTSLKIGYVPWITTPSSLTIATMPDTVEETFTLSNTLLIGSTTSADFVTPANLYPTDTAINIKVRLRGWCYYNLDFARRDDSTSMSGSSSSPTIDAFYIPRPPDGVDTTFPYGTWGEVRATQVNSRPIRWYRDSTAAPFYSPSQYNASKKWSNTPQYFHDSTYYLNCISEKGCASNFSEVHVHVAALYSNDIAFEEVLAPLGNRVYMENDTVRLRIGNYGTNTQTSIPVHYQLKRGSTILQDVEETCHASIATLESHVYTFDSLLQIPTPTSRQSYTLQVWTDLPSDAVRRNDTIRIPYTFISLDDSTYHPQGSSNPSFDVTRVSFNEIDLDMPPLGRGLSVFCENYSEPEYPTLHLAKGTVDTLFVQVTPLDQSSRSSRCRIWTYIDYDRSGTYSSDEEVVSGEAFYNNQLFSAPITIPESASYGYMRMRVVVSSYDAFADPTYSPTYGVSGNKDGHTLDFLLFVDAEAPATDVSINQIVSPRSQLIRDNDPRVVSFRVANKGTNAVSGVDFKYAFYRGESIDSTTTVNTLNWVGNIAPGASVVVSLPEYNFPFGTSKFRVWHEIPEDTIHYNDTLDYEYHHFRTIRPVLDDNFDSINQWYAPKGYNEYTRNYWQRGYPTKQRLNTCVSDSNAWVTDLNNNIVSGTRGNVSYLYSPVIDIAQVKADTLSFYLRRHLTSGSSLHLEYYNYENKWVKLDQDSTEAWYNNEDDHVFDGNTSGNDYNYYWVKTNAGGLSGEFHEKLQFRFVYTTPQTSSATSAFGEGCAIDNFLIGRARRAIDAAIIDISEPIAPSYGQTIYPRIVVKNFGYDTLRQFEAGYYYYGTYLARLSMFNCNIAPEDTASFLFPDPFIVTSDFPEEFSITAFTTIQQDIYRDNDTVVKSFSLSPLENDISVHQFLYPLDHVIAGDSNIFVTMRIRNFGSNPIYHARASYIVNGANRVDEDIDFVEIKGTPLESMEYFNYTFRQKFRAPMGVMKIVGIIKSDSNDYIYNDTISKRIEGITSVTDLAAASIIVDTSSFNEVRIQLVIENRGARGANGFEVGFYIDGDTNTIHREVFNQNFPVAALSTGYHMFDFSLPTRAARYTDVTGFVHIEGDHDASNDTTKVLATQFHDIELVKIIVVENAQPDCNVYMQLRNNGNLVLRSGTLQLKATINGENLTRNTPQVIRPGDSVNVPFNHTIPKSPQRSYVGSGKMTLSSDNNPDNNETNRIDVYNYLDVPFVIENEFQLDQNYPNPFTHRTTVPFSLPNPASVRFFVVDAMGHVVHSFDRHYDAGYQTIEVDLSAFPSGIYFYGIEVNGERRMRKMIMH